MMRDAVKGYVCGTLIAYCIAGMGVGLFMAGKAIFLGDGEKFMLGFSFSISCVYFFSWLLQWDL